MTREGFGSQTGPLRAPVYLAVDCSGSMSGDERVPLSKSPWAAVQLGLVSLLDELEDNRMFYDLAYVTVITFGANARVHSGPTLAREGIELSPLPRPEGCTDYRLMLRCVNEALERDLEQLTAQRCDVKEPIVFILTDGYPHTSQAGPQPESEWLPELKKLHGLTVQRPEGPRPCHVVPFGVGKADQRVLCMLRSQGAPAYLVTGDPAEATTRAMVAIVRSVADSTMKGQLAVTPPNGTAHLWCS